jgi:transposase
MSYPSDLTDREWARLEPVLKSMNKKSGQPRKHDLRAVMNGILYVLCDGIRWRSLPHDFPPWDDVYAQFRRWRDRGVWPKICATLTRQARQSAGRLGEASLLILDTQTVQSAPGNSPRRKKGGSTR